MVYEINTRETGQMVNLTLAQTTWKVHLLSTLTLTNIQIPRQTQNEGKKRKAKYPNHNAINLASEFWDQILCSKANVTELKWTLQSVNTKVFQLDPR